MMNNMNQSDAELQTFLKQDRIRLFNERNQYKAMAEQAELELEDARVNPLFVLHRPPNRRFFYGSISARN